MSYCHFLIHGYFVPLASTSMYICNPNRAVKYAIERLEMHIDDNIGDLKADATCDFSMVIAVKSYLKTAILKI